MVPGKIKRCRPEKGDPEKLPLSAKLPRQKSLTPLLYPVLATESCAVCSWDLGNITIPILVFLLDEREPSV